MAEKDVNIKVQAKTDQAQQNIKKLTDLLKGTGKGAGEQVSGFKKLGTAIAGAFSVKKIVDFNKSALHLRADFEQSMYNVKALTQANAQQFEQLKDKAREMGVATVYTAKDAADAMGVMGQMGWETEQIMGAIRPTLDLATASNTGLARSSEIVVKSMKAFHEPVERAGHVSDTFAKIQAKTGTNLTQLGEAMKYVAPVAYQMGMDIDTTSKYIGILADNSIQGSMAGTSLRTMFARLANPVENVAKGLEKYTEVTGVAIPQTASVQQKIELLAKGWGKLNKNQKIQLADMIAGKNAMPGFLTLMDGYADKMGYLDKVMKDNKITAKDLADTQKNNLYGAIKAVQSAWEELQLSFTDGKSQIATDALFLLADILNRVSNELKYVGNCMEMVYNDYLKPAFEGINKFLTDIGINSKPISDFFSKTLGQSKEFQVVVGTLGLLFAGLGIIVLPLVGIIGSLKFAFGGLHKILLKIPLAFGLIGDAIEAFKLIAATIGLSISPMVVGFGILLVVLAMVYIHWDELTEFLKTSWEDFDSKFTGWLENENNKLLEWQEAAGKAIQGQIDKLLDLWKEYNSGDSILTTFKGKVITAWNDMKRDIGTAVDKIKEKVRNMFNVKFTLPHIPVPHFEKSGSFSLMPPSMPKFSFTGWKARGAIFQKPTMMGSYGVGDASNGHGSNPEAVLPIDELPTLLGLDRIHTTLDMIEQSSNIVNFVVDGRTLAQGTYRRFDNEGGQRIKLAERGIR